MSVPEERYDVVESMVESLMKWNQTQRAIERNVPKQLPSVSVSESIVAEVSEGLA